MKSICDCNHEDAEIRKAAAMFWKFSFVKSLHIQKSLFTCNSWVNKKLQNYEATKLQKEL